MYSAYVPETSAFTLHEQSSNATSESHEVGQTR